MEENTISKKELLQKYGISYGALYRWKRKGLIPDEWFIRRSTATGQETYFPREAICERIEAVIRLRDRDGVQLDDMADIFNPRDEKCLILTVRGKFGSRDFTLSELTGVTMTDKKTGESAELLGVITDAWERERENEPRGKD